MRKRWAILLGILFLGVISTAGAQDIDELQELDDVVCFNNYCYTDEVPPETILERSPEELSVNPNFEAYMEDLQVNGLIHDPELIHIRTSKLYNWTPSEQFPYRNRTIYNAPSWDPLMETDPIMESTRPMIILWQLP